MPRGNKSESVPKELQQRFKEISGMIDALCQEYLNGMAAALPPANRRAEPQTAITAAHR